MAKNIKGRKQLTGGAKTPTGGVGKDPNTFLPKQIGLDIGSLAIDNDALFRSSGANNRAVWQLNAEQKHFDAMTKFLGSGMKGESVSTQNKFREAIGKSENRLTQIKNFIRVSGITEDLTESQNRDIHLRDPQTGGPVAPPRLTPLDPEEKKDVRERFEGDLTETAGSPLELEKFKSGRSRVKKRLTLSNVGGRFALLRSLGATPGQNPGRILG